MTCTRHMISSLKNKYEIFNLNLVAKWQQTDRGMDRKT